MPSTYSSKLRLELPATGEQAGTWGTTMNTDLGTLVENAIAGTAVVALPGGAGDYTLTTANGADDEARQAIVKITAALTANRNVICPSVSKLYLVYNATSGAFTVTFKTAAGTGVLIPQGEYRYVYCDGTNVVNTNFDGQTHSATSKATPVDADELPVADSAASFGLKKLTWANTKATLKTYFDTLYLALAGGNLTGGINSARGNITQNATTMDFFAITSPGVLDGAGSAVTITACVNAPQAGAVRIFYPLANTVLTHGATFDIAGNANLTAATGDAWVIEAKTTSTYKAYAIKKDGTAVASASAFNDIINGQFRIAQIGTSFAAPATGVYDLDGWFQINTSAAVFTVAQAAGRSTGKLCRSVTVTTADAAVAAGDLVAQCTAIEGSNCVKYLTGASAIGVWITAPVTGVHCVSVYNGTSSYVQECNVAVANTPQFFTIQLPVLPVIASSTNAAGLVLRVCNMAGATYQTTAGAWNTGNLYATSNQVNDMATNANVFKLEDVTLNLGSYAAVDTISYEDELYRCQRYYESSFPLGTAPAQNAGIAGAIGGVQVVGASTSQGCAIIINFHVPKRAAGGTFISFNPSAANAQIRNLNTATDCSSIAAQLSGKDSYTLSCTTPAGSAAGQLLALHWSYDVRL